MMDAFLLPKGFLTTDPRGESAPGCIKVFCKFSQLFQKLWSQRCFRHWFRNVDSHLLLGIRRGGRQGSDTCRLSSARFSSLQRANDIWFSAFGILEGINPLHSTHDYEWIFSQSHTWKCRTLLRFTFWDRLSYSCNRLALPYQNTCVPP